MDFKSQLNASTVDVNVLELLLIQDKSTNESIHNQCIDRARSLTLAQTLTDNTAGTVQVSSVPIRSDPIWRQIQMIVEWFGTTTTTLYHRPSSSSSGRRWNRELVYVAMDMDILDRFLDVKTSYPTLYYIIPQGQVKKERYEKAVM
jgi:hypothetical protein